MKDTRKLEFENIDNREDLIAYLKETIRLNNVKLTRYMNRSNLINLFSSGYMFLNNPKRMNDQYELQAFPEADWDKICFTSFLAQSNENMAMWGMYAQPWTDGVMISIPGKTMQKMWKEGIVLVEAIYDKKTRRYEPGTRIIPAENIFSISRIVYKNDDNIDYGEKHNSHFTNPYNIPELAGFVKDSAWDYEKEVRVRVDLPDAYEETAVFLKLNDDFLSQISITTGPRFEGDVLTSLPERFRGHIAIMQSKFKGKLAWIPCDNCEYKE